MKFSATFESYIFMKIMIAFTDRYFLAVFEPLA